MLSTLLFLSIGGASALAGEAKFEAQLIWATNDKESKDPKLKPVDSEIQKKLTDLPLKWEHYYSVKSERFTVSKGGTNFVTMSEKCMVEIKRLGDSKVEVALHGKQGSICAKRTQPLPKGEILVVGGNAPNATAWLVTLKRIE